MIDEVNESDEDIVNRIGMANLPQIIDVLYKKYAGQYQLIDIGGDCMLRFGNTNVANVSYLATYVHFIEVNDEFICIEGNVSWPTVIADKFVFYVICNGKRYDCELLQKNLDLKNEEVSYETRDVFYITIPLWGGDKQEISFIYECGGILARSGKINAMRFSPVCDVLKNQYAYINGRILYIEDGKIIVENCKEREKLYVREELFSNSHNDAEIAHLRKEYYKYKEQKTKPIWLFMDRFEKADDNGEAFFRYVSEKHSEIESYFIISEKSDDYLRLKKYGNVIPALTEEHFLLLFLADYIFTSQLNGWVENPFKGKEEFFRDLYHNAKVVFLQHGVTKDNHSKWLNRYKQNLHAIVTSSDCEYKAFLEDSYGYSEKQIWNVMMPRFDYLYESEPKYILIMPTWRKELMKNTYSKEKGIFKWNMKDESCAISEYFITYSKLLNSQRLRSICDLLNYKILFAPHPLIQEYISCFQVPDYVEVRPYSDSFRGLFSESALLITDYSSVAFDFAYIGRSIIYFQFDEEEFFKNHTYSKGYFEYKTMGFGPIVRDLDELLNVIEDEVNNHLKMRDEYRVRRENFFSYFDKGSCNRLFEEVMHYA